MSTAGLMLVLVPGVRALALRLGAVDAPGPRRAHRQPTPTLGGLAMYVALLVGLAVVTAWYPQYFADRVLALAGAGLLIALVGAADDLYDLSAWIKVPVEIVAAVLVYQAGFRFDVLSYPLGPGELELGWVGLPLTVVWIVGVANAINLLDGLDGLACGVTAIAAAACLLATLALGGAEAAVLYCLVLGLCVGFLRYNRWPAAIFMGDTGSLLLGFLLACAAVLGENKRMVLFALLPVGLPVLDALLAIVRRWRQGRSILAPDQAHLHHRLLQLGWTQRAVVRAYWLVSLYLALSAVVMVYLQRQYMLVMLVLYGIGLLLAYGLLRYLELRLHHPLTMREQTSRASHDQDPNA